MLNYFIFSYSSSSSRSIPKDSKTERHADQVSIKCLVFVQAKMYFVIKLFLGRLPNSFASLDSTQFKALLEIILSTMIKQFNKLGE